VKLRKQAAREAAGTALRFCKVMPVSSFQTCWARAAHPALEEHLRLPAGEEGRVAGGPPLVPAAEARLLPGVRRPETLVLAKVACHAHNRRTVMRAAQRAAGARRAVTAGRHSMRECVLSIVCLRHAAVRRT